MTQATTPLSAETRAAILADATRGDPYREICARYGVSMKRVSKIAIAGGARRRSRPGALTPEQEADLAARYQAGEPVKELSAAFTVCRDTVLDIVHRAGAPSRPRGPVPLPLRHDALDVLTPEAAYWCGMMFTDGTIGRRPRRQPEIALVLQKRDREHLVKWRDFLGATNAITPIAPAKVAKGPFNPNGGQGKGAFRICVSSRQIADRLDALGRYGPAVDPELAASRDFWRGVIDGDGCVNISCGVPGVKLWGSRWLLSTFVDFLGPVSSRRPINVRPVRNLFMVSTSYRTAEKIMDRLYVDASVALDRKAAAVAAILAGRKAEPQLW